MTWQQDYKELKYDCRESVTGQVSITLLLFKYMHFYNQYLYSFLQ